ncbi:MAG: pyridoxal phosphate-dependent aminotransferase [Firmicutes bacterium]|jgi:aspartate/methionine/tyrosine aminotransferase|nr:pyridoxal phosphate-dependent aminotransferase [Bacillota bacterium]
MKQAERAGRLEAEGAFEVMKVVMDLRAQGRDIVNLFIGEPDFDTPNNIKAAGCKAIEDNYTHYSPAAGVPSFRKTIAEFISTTRGVDVSPDEVVVSPGTKPMIFHSILACVEPGTEVIGANPSYPAYPSIVHMVGAEYVSVPLVEERGFALDIDRLESLVTPRTSMIILNSPHNPTGGVLSRSDLERIAAISIENDLWVMSDEIYSRLVYDGEFASIASIPGMKDRTILIDGFSKTYAMTGWRLGFGVMNRDLARTLDLFMMNAESCTATFTQYAGIEGLAGPQDEPERMRREFQARRDLLVRELNRIPGFRCHLPGGAFYAFPNVTEACRMLGLKDSEALQRALLEEAGVAVLPRTSFGRPNPGETEQYLRVSYTSREERLLEGTNRMREFIEARAS